MIHEMMIIYHIIKLVSSSYFNCLIWGPVLFDGDAEFLVKMEMAEIRLEMRIDTPNDALIIVEHMRKARKRKRDLLRHTLRRFLNWKQ
jgi:hypothetical protein